MYNKNPLLFEFSPSELFLAGKHSLSHLKLAGNSAKIAAKKVLKGKGKLTQRIGNEISNIMKKDPTLLGDAVRGSETARQTLSAMILQQLEPLPTADIQSIKQAINSAIFTLKRGNVTKKPISLLGLKFHPHTVPQVAKKALSNPVESAKELVVNRATAGTYAESGINNYNGIISRIFGLSGMPVIDGSATMVAMKSAGINGNDLVAISRSTKDAYMGSLRDKISKARKIYSKIVNRKRIQNIQ